MARLSKIDLIKTRVMPSVMTAPQREISSDELGAQVAAYLAAGGTIQRIEIGRSALVQGLTPTARGEALRASERGQKALGFRKPRRAELTAAQGATGPRYHGSPCKRCSETLRYTDGSSCVACKMARNRAASAARRAQA